jgi:hypothetical protein
MKILITRNKENFEFTETPCRIFINCKIERISSPEKKIRTIIINSDFLHKMQKQTVIEFLSGLPQTDEEKKQLIRQSPFTGILKTKTGELNESTRLSLLLFFLQKTKAELLHFKYPARFFGLQQLIQLPLQLIKIPFLIWEDCIFPPGADFDYLISTGKLIRINRNEQPLIDELPYFSREPYQIFHASMNNNAEGWFLKSGNISFPVEETDRNLFMGLMEQKFLLALNSDSFDYSPKQKPGFIRVELLSQSCRGSRYYARFELNGFIFAAPLEKRLPTPAIFIKPLFRKCFYYHPETKSPILLNKN